MDDYEELLLFFDYLENSEQCSDPYLACYQKIILKKDWNRLQSKFIVPYEEITMKRVEAIERLMERLPLVSSIGQLESLIIRELEVKEDMVEVKKLEEELSIIKEYQRGRESRILSSTKR